MDQAWIIQGGLVPHRVPNNEAQPVRIRAGGPLCSPSPAQDNWLNKGWSALGVQDSGEQSNARARWHRIEPPSASLTITLLLLLLLSRRSRKRTSCESNNYSHTKPFCVYHQPLIQINNQTNSFTIFHGGTASWSSLYNSNTIEFLRSSLLHWNCNCNICSVMFVCMIIMIKKPLLFALFN